MSPTTPDWSWWDFNNAMGRAGSALTGSEHRVLHALSTYANGPGRHPKLGNARPGKKRLARDTGYSESTVKRALDELEKRKWIVVTAPGGNQHGHAKATTYRLQIPANYRGQTQEQAGQGRREKKITGEATDALEGVTRGMAEVPKGVTHDPLQTPEGVMGDPLRVSPVMQKGVTGDPPPAQDRPITSPYIEDRPHASSAPRTVQGLIARSTIGREGDEASPETSSPPLEQVLKNYGIPREYHREVLAAAERDPTTKTSAQGRLSAVPGYARQMLDRIKAERRAAIDSSPRCEEHESNPASHCPSCRADFLAGDRPPEYLGRRYSPTGLGQP